MAVYLGILTALFTFATFPKPIVFLFTEEPEYRDTRFFFVLLDSIIENPLILAINIPMLLALGYTTKVLWNYSKNGNEIYSEDSEGYEKRYD